MAEDALWLTVVSALVFLVWLDHLVHQADLYRRERTARTFRGLFVAVMLQIGFFSILLGASIRAFPDQEWLLIGRSITGPLLSLLILSGGFVMAWSWRRYR